MHARFARICPLLLTVVLGAVIAAAPARCQVVVPNSEVRRAPAAPKANVAPPPSSPQAAPTDHRRRNAIIVAAAAAAGLLIVFFHFHHRNECSNCPEPPSMHPAMSRSGPG